MVPKHGLLLLADQPILIRIIVIVLIVQLSEKHLMRRLGLSCCIMGLNGFFHVLVRHLLNGGTVHFMIARSRPVVSQTFHRFVFVFEERTTKKQAVFNRELLGRLLEVKVVFDLIASLAAMHVTTVQTLPEVVTGIGSQGQGRPANLDVNSLINACLKVWYGDRFSEQL